MRTSNEPKRPRTILMMEASLLAFVRLDRLGAAPHDGQDRRAVLRRHGVHATVRPVVHVARGHRARFVGFGPFDDEDQLIARVTMERELGVGLDARHDGPSLAFRVLPDALRPDPGLPFLPWEVADRDDLRHWSLRGRHGVASSRWFLHAGRAPRYFVLSFRSS